MDISYIYAEVFYIDGSLRDLIVSKTNKQDWQTLLNFFRMATYPLEFIVAGELQPLPERIEDIFTLHETINLQINERDLALHCHFFTDEEIEFDLDPQDFHNELQVSRLLDFIHTIGRQLGKEIFLTPEGMHDIPLFRFDPTTGKEQWIWEDDDE